MSSNVVEIGLNIRWWHMLFNIFIRMTVNLCLYRDVMFNVVVVDFGQLLMCVFKKLCT